MDQLLCLKALLVLRNEFKKLYNLSIHIYIYLSIYLTVCPSIYLSTCSAACWLWNCCCWVSCSWINWSAKAEGLFCPMLDSSTIHFSARFRLLAKSSPPGSNKSINQPIYQSLNQSSNQSKNTLRLLANTSQPAIKQSINQ